jgi:hypothetical protein
MFRFSRFHHPATDYLVWFLRGRVRDPRAARRRVALTPAGAKRHGPALPRVVGDAVGRRRFITSSSDESLYQNPRRPVPPAGRWRPATTPA